MKAEEIIKMIKTGVISAYTLFELTPRLARANDPAAPVLLNYQNRHRLWKDWGFLTEQEYLEKAGIPLQVIVASTALMLRDDLTECNMTDEARQAIEQLLKEEPNQMSRSEFGDRLEALVVVLERSDRELREKSNEHRRAG